jgi:diketogulonate reductase-like aldo/keto reductase
MHSLAYVDGVTDDDWAAWGMLEKLYQEGRARAIGVSNVSAGQIEELCRDAKIKPAFVQNRCYAARSWDAEAREVCRKHGVVYQGFSLLTANPHVVGSKTVAEIGRRLGATPAQTVLAFARALGILPLTGTTDPLHMKQDLASLALALSAEDVAAISAVD